VTDDEWQELRDLGAEVWAAPVDPRDHDLRGQGLTAWQMYTITDLTITGEWL
jgi:hypothetical protein